MRRTALLCCWAAFGCSDPGQAVLDAGLDAKQPDPRVTVVETYDVAEVNTGLVDDMLTVDLSVSLTVGAGISWTSIKTDLEAGRNIFNDVGLQVRITSAQLIDVPTDWQALDPSVSVMPQTPEFLDRDLYAHLEETETRLAPRTEDILTAIVSHLSSDDIANMLHLVTLDEVPIEFWEWDGAVWTNQVIDRTGGLSMPTYVFEDRIPEDIRGVFTISGVSGTKTLYHEMGHKLINVSHEGATVCPSFAANGPELMLYGNGTFIGAGRDNRWHVERLHKSPYLYQTSAGSRTQNPAYLGSGNYSDLLYGEHIMEPVCE